MIANIIEIESLAFTFEKQSFMLDRRVFLSLIAGVASAAASSPVEAQSRIQSLIQNVIGTGKSFSRAAVVAAARELAKQPFFAPANALPEPFSGLNQEQYGEIRTKPETALWADQNRGFIVEPLHRGYVFDVPVLVYSVEDDVVLGIAYDQNRFTFGKLNPPQNMPDLAYSGLRISVVEDGKQREIANFQGATFFRSQARGQLRGGMARAVSIKTGDPRGEEISQWRAFWLERPTIGQPLIVHAIADSESLVAAFRFSIRPGDVTLIDTEVTFIARSPVDNIGFGGMQAMHFFGPASPRRSADDYRAAVHEASGLQIQRGNGEWVWRPLNNPGQLQVSSFLDENVKGFGLVQRNREFLFYQDDDQHFEMKPTIWIEPLSEFGVGVVQLIEIPTEADFNQNIVAFWRPKNPLQPGQEVNIAYRQFWCWQVPERPDIGAVFSTRVGRVGAKRRRFVVDFSLGQLSQDAKSGDLQSGDLKIALTNNNVGTIVGQRLIYDAERKTARVMFDLDPGNETLIELRLLLEAGSKALTETWLYRWTPQ